MTSQKTLGSVLLILCTYSINLFVWYPRIHDLIFHKCREISNVASLNRTVPVYLQVTFLVEISFRVLGDMTIRNATAFGEICRLLVLGKFLKK